MMKPTQALCFDDVLIKPRYSEISSRREIDISTDLGRGIQLKVPIVSSPMDTVTEASMLVSMSSFGGMGIVHRYNSPIAQSMIVSEAYSSGAKNIGFAIGVGDDAIGRAVKCVNAGANMICIDVAHGHHSLVRYTLEALRNTLGFDIHIMAGNIATPAGYEDLSRWGADSIRVGIGGGSICSTRIQTGHGMPTFQSVIDCSSADGSARIIADGGIRNSGDIVKCLAAGADCVMLGSLLAGSVESPGSVEITETGERIKAYRGMASKDAQINWRGHYSSVEGVTSHVKLTGPAEDTLFELVNGIRSGLSYSGCTNIMEFSTRAEFTQQSTLGQRESGTHIFGGK